ncbi:MAG: hypothetical protein N2235_18225 [Fischerella sp.]|nr:hypothetical protein [Fischerella sp.]
MFARAKSPRNMPQILVWKCPYTGTIFENRDKYAKHLRALRNQRAFERKISQANRDRNKFFEGMRATVQTFKQLEQFIINNWEQFLTNGLNKNSARISSAAKIEALSTIKLKSIRFCNMHWNPCASNTHSCPIDGVINWSRTSKMSDGTPAPVGYPGWQGRLKFELTENNIVSGSDFFDKTGINTGTGSGASNKYEYDVTLFDDDWPAMISLQHKLRMANVLSDDKFTVSDLM